MRKKFLAFVLSLTLAAGMLAGCGSEKKDEGNTENANNTAENSQGEGGGGGQTAASGNAIVVSGGDVTYSLDTLSIAPDVSVNLGGLYVTDSMVDTGILRTGSVQRLADALYRASIGEEITIAVIGGAAGYGVGASDENKAYPQLIKKWWDDTFPKTDIKMINISIPGQDSYIANHRICDEIIPKRPDVVYIETALTDNSYTYAEESFECMARQLLASDSEPAIIPIVLTNYALAELGGIQSALAMQMDLPLISPGAVVKTNVDNGTWKWTDIAEGENSNNPNDAGHALVAYLATAYSQRVLDGITSSSYTRYTLTESKKTKCRYMNGKFITDDDLSSTGFEKLTLPGADLGSFRKGWGTTSGNSGEFTVSGKNVGVVWFKTTDGSGGIFDVTVDGEAARAKLSASNSDGTDEEAQTSLDRAELGKFDTDSHTIKFTTNSETVGKSFYVIGFCVSGS